MRAILSVSDQTGIAAFARGLRELGWDLIATDGTRAALAADGIDSRGVEEVTGSPAMLGGRVKTLHPAIFGGLLARRARPDDLAAIRAHGPSPHHRMGFRLL